jgi:hypothetical protein
MILGNVTVMVQTKAKFEALLGNEKFKDYEVLVGHGIDNDPSYFRIVIKHKTHQHKGTLVQALLAKHTGNKTPFVLTMGDMKMDEPMHQLAKLLNQYSILVKNKEINIVWETNASHSLENHEEAIHLLGYLAGMKTLKQHYADASLKIGEILASITRTAKSLLENIKSIPQSLHEYIFQNPTSKFNQEFHVHIPSL